MIEEVRRVPGRLARLLVIFLSFCALDLLFWPILFSYHLWIFADRSNFLNLDYMLAEHLRLAVDAYYVYGLLPVLIQHLLFVVFGRGYWPLLGCNLVVLILFTVFWSSFVRIVSDRWLYLLAVVAICPLLMCVNLNLPYQMVEVSMLFTLLFLLEGRPEIALAVSAIGCLSVPSLPLLLTGLVALYIAVDWWTSGDRSLSLLARRFAPGVLTYASLAAILGAFFGFQSMLRTSLPFLGVNFYYGGSGKFDFTDLITFIHPPGHSFKYYVGYYIASPATWWVLSTIGMVILGLFALRTMIRNRRPDPLHSVVLFCAIVQVFFALVAYRGEDQHGIYDPITAAGILAAIATIPAVRWRNRLLILLTCIGVMGQAATARRTLSAWKNTRPSALTMNLYAEPEFGPQLTKILDIAKTQKLLMMSNPTGVHHYYPTIHSADTWFLVKSQMFPSDHERVIANIKDADVVVEDTTHVPYFTDRDPDVQAQLRSMCLTDVMRDFQIWWRHPPDSAICKVNPRSSQSKTESTAPTR
jgi:hypothetical protein